MYKRQVDHTSICVERGDFVTIVGKSGSGKSTLLHLIGGLDNPTSGEVWIDNECMTNMNEEDLSAFRRRKIGFIFQAFNLVPSLNVWENIILPIGLDDRKPEVESAISACGLPLNIRGEALSLEQFAALTNAFCCTASR